VILRAQNKDDQGDDTDNDCLPLSGCQWHASWKDNNLWRAGGHHRRCR
jgi:hypothetical protein